MSQGQGDGIIIEKNSTNGTSAVNLKPEFDSIIKKDLCIESINMPGMYDHRNSKNIIKSEVNAEGMGFGYSEKNVLPVLPECSKASQNSNITITPTKLTISSLMKSQKASYNLLNISNQEKYQKEISFHNSALSTLCERLSVNDVKVDYSDEDFINLTNHLVYTEYISAMLEAENPEVPSCDILELAEAKWKQFLSIKESKTETNKNKISQELLDLLEPDYCQEDYNENPEDEGDEDYMEGGAAHGQYTKKEQSHWECSFCEYSCSTAEMYNCHLRNHRGENPYSCLICNERFQERKKLKIHTNLVHNRELDYKYFSCYHCEFRCKKSDNFTIHVLQHSDNNDTKPFECPKCFVGFRFKLWMKNHIRKVHFDRSTTQPYQCKDCNYTSFRRENMRDHMYTHTGEKPHGCPFCEYRCITATNLKVHLLIHTGEKKHLCNICGFKCTQKSSLKTHMKIHSNERSYLCTECGFRSNTSGNLLVHMRTHTGEKKYLCKICGSRFTQSQSLKMHINKVHSIYECPVCQKEIEEINILRTHMVDVHNCEPKLQVEKYCKNEKKYKCSECDKSFTQSHNLKLHKQKVHTNKKETDIGENLEYHTIISDDSCMSIRKNQQYPKKFSCTECDKSFTQSHNLKAHILKHTGEKPFSCKHCKYCCTTKKKLAQHIRCMHLVNDAQNVGLKSDDVDENMEQDISLIESDRI